MKIFFNMLLTGTSVKSAIICLFLMVLVSGLMAQPSGGPYGPIQKNYSLPAIEGKIDFVAPDGNAESTGEKPDNPTTINAAIERVKTGDAIIIRGGVYRTGNLILNLKNSITMFMFVVKVHQAI